METGDGDGDSVLRKTRQPQIPDKKMESGDVPPAAVERKIRKARRKITMSSSSTTQPTSTSINWFSKPKSEELKPEASNISNINKEPWTEIRSKASGTPLPPSTSNTDTEENPGDAKFDGDFSSIREKSSQYVNALPVHCSTSVNSNASFTEIYSESSKYFENHFPGLTPTPVEQAEMLETFPEVPTEPITSDPNDSDRPSTSLKCLQYHDHVSATEIPQELSSSAEVVETLFSKPKDPNASRVEESPAEAVTSDSNDSDRPSTSSKCLKLHDQMSTPEIPQGLSSSSQVVEILFSKPNEPNARRVEDKVDLALLQSVYRDAEFQRLRSDILATATEPEPEWLTETASTSSSMSSLPEVGQRKWYQQTGRRAILERFSLKNMEVLNASTMFKVRNEATSLNYYEITSNNVKQLRQTEMLANLKAFVNTPVAIGFELNCEIIRDRRGLGLFPHFFLNLELGGTKITLLIGRKRKKTLRSNILISTDPSELKRYGPAHVGTLRSNLFMKKFTVFDGRPKREVTDHIGFDGVVTYREQIGSVIYGDDKDWFAPAGTVGPRRMRTFIPAIINECQRLEIRPSGSREAILEQGLRRENNGILELKNKCAVWDTESQAFALQFEGDVVRQCKPSFVTFQLVHQEDENEIICQFGRVDKDTFNLDFRYPLCPLQAFAIALSSLSTTSVKLHNETVVFKYPAGGVS